MKTTPSEFKVERGVPIPTGRIGKPHRYPWNSLKPGDSFFVPETAAKGSSLRALCSWRRRVHGETYTVSVEGDGVRVWLVERPINGKAK